jgi:hypothetical protein
MANEWDMDRLQEAIRKKVSKVTKEARTTWSKLDIHDLVTPVDRAEALHKSFAYSQQAAQVQDLELAASYSELAAEHRAVIAGPQGHLAKAAEYEAKAAQVTDPVQRQNYEQLARQARQDAGAV